MSFLNPLFFWGMMAASVPVLLHLMRRERARKIEFPSLMFLRRVSKKTIRYQKLRHLLLLLLRVLALALLVLAFTRPFRDLAPVAASTGKPSVAHIVLLDNSLSLSYRDRWDRARKAAADIIHAAGAGDKFSVLEFSDRALARTQLTSDKTLALGQIENGVAPTDRPTKYTLALKLAERMALEAGTGKRIVHLVSDFQRSGGIGEDPGFRLSSAVELKAVDIGAREFTNLTFGDVRLVEAEDAKGGNLRIKAAVVNFGTEDRKNVGVNLLLDGRVTKQSRLDVGRASSQGVEFELPGLTPGLHPIILELEDENLTRDNRFCMAVEARGKTTVTSVEDPKSGRGGRSPSFFLSHALNVSTLSPYLLAPMTLQRAETLASIPPSLIIWNNASASSDSLQKKLQESVRAGGGLVIVLADSVRASEFNRTFGAWLPVRMEEGPAPSARRTGKPLPADDYALLTDIRTDHPIFQPFGSPNSGSFTQARFFNHARVTPGEGAAVIARFDNGDPALVATEVGKGHVLTFTSSADDEWNDLPVYPVFAPLWQQMLRFVDNSQEGRRWVEIGETISPRKIVSEAARRRGHAEPDPNQALVVMNPAKEREALIPGADAFTVDRTGYYDLRTSSIHTLVAVNPVPRESDLTPANAEELVAGWSSPEAGAPQAAAADERMSAEEQERSQRFWRYLLGAVLVFLICEGVLANRLVLKPE